MKKIFSILVFFSLSSCFYGSFRGLTSGYKNQKNNLHIKFVDQINNLQKNNNDTIYSVNAETLREEMAKHERSLLYFWSPYCSSEVCLPLYTVQQMCDENGVELFVILEYYDEAVKEFYGKTKNPLFSIDHLFYQTNFANKYQERFREDIIKEKIKDSLAWYRYFHFEKDNFLGAERNLLKSKLIQVAPDPHPAFAQ